MTKIEDILADLLGRETVIDSIPGVPAHSPVLEVKRLPSRKNEVHLIRTSGRDVVLKKFDNDRWVSERDILLLCRSQGILVPEPVLSGEGFILMDFLRGPDLRDLINETLDPVYPRALAEWLAHFHLLLEDEKGTLVRSDAKLQNFILTEEGIAGLDFELAHRGDPLEDMGEVCAHILNTDPMFIEEKYDLCNEFLQRYAEVSGRSIQGIAGWIVRSLEEAAHFRPHQRERLLSEAERFRNGDVWPFIDDQNR